MAAGEVTDRMTEAGAKEDQLLAAIVRAASSPIVLIDLFGRILYANPATTVFRGAAPKQWRGMSVDRLVDMGNLTQHLRMLRENQTVQLEGELIRADGSRQPMWVSLFPLAGDPSEVPSAAAVILHDVSPQRQALAKTQRQLEELELLNKVSLAVSSSLELEQIMSILLEETRETLNVEACSVALLDEARNDLFFLMADGVGATHVRGARMPVDVGVLGWVVRNRQPLIVPRVEEDSRFFAGIDNLTGERTRSLMCTPLEAHGKVIGGLEAMNKKTGEFTNEDLRLFKLIAASAATAISNALLYKQQQEAIEQLRIKNRELIESRDREIRRERLAAIDQISVTVHHEVNNPLTGILTLSEWMLKRKDLPEDLVSDLMTIRDQAERIRNVVHKLSELNDDRTVDISGHHKMIDLGL